ncbi:PilZ domain-containing protein [Pseudoalteromonas rubra]|uniref:PilZ domain-containing protein n=1 Tax=Pseudoalteromonas rubra TaxID=43658 RepID=A0A0F4QHB8_9GAMM|nr:PilZ domain-containing protein [Pseudoalteromonas rubra]KJZ06996.1 hypothetical protein TW77_17445 [Pseudoalteromonas rubra]
MAEDKLQQYQDLIDELKIDLGDPNFDFIFKQKTAQLSKPDQFLLKMEMTRLSQPVARFIDLRGQVSGQVKPYEYEGKQHFMDDVAIRVFEQEVARYGGYTLAVYEAVMNTDNNFKVMQKQAAQQQDEDTPGQDLSQATQYIRFASYESRIEERMNYSIKITVEFGNQRLANASTSDISLSGAKIKLAPNYHLHKGDLVSLRLVGLEQDFELGLKSGIQYEVVAVDPVSNEYNHVRLKRTFVENNSGFDDFLQSFIHGNKRRYKINLDNTMDAVVCKGYEQYYLPRVNSLFVFFSQAKTMLYPSLVLTNENNAHINYYFEDERKTSSLYSVFNQQRLDMLLQRPEPVKEAYCYTFTHGKNGKIYFYSAFDWELKKSAELHHLFMGFGSQKDSWRIFKVQLMPSHHEDAFIPLSLPSSAGKNVEKLNKRPTPRVQGLIENVKYLMTLSDITTEQQTAYYQALQYTKEQVNLIKQFGHGKAKVPPPLEVVALEYVNLRSHKRYLYKTAVAVAAEDGAVLHGHTRDFSVMGLQVALDEPATLQKGDIVHLDLPELQKITKQHNLTKLRYEVMAVNKAKTIINLKVNILSNVQHTAITFFKILIENNKNKLQPCEEAPRIPGLSHALRNMVTKSICQFPLYLHKSAAHFKIGAIGQGLYPTTLHKILLSEVIHHNHQEYVQPHGLLPSDFIGEYLSERLRKQSRQDKPLQYTVFLRFDPKAQTLQEALKSQCIAAGESLDPLFLFIKRALKKELLFVFHLYISKTGRPDMDYLANELRYVSHYAIHKAKGLEEALWNVAGVCDMIEVTDQLLPTLDVEDNQLAAMLERKRAWLATQPGS